MNQISTNSSEVTRKQPQRRVLMQHQREMYNARRRELRRKNRLGADPYLDIEGTVSSSSTIDSENFINDTFPNASRPHAKKRRISNTLSVIPFDQYCSLCGAKKFKAESRGFCCYNGEVSLYIPQMPPELINLYTSDNKEGQEFRRLVRAYNTLFGFTSMGAEYDKRMTNMTSGVYTYKIQGQIYHRLPSLRVENDDPKFLQLYFYDSGYQISKRIERMEDLPVETVTKIMNILSGNPYACFLKELKDIENFEQCEISIHTECGQDQRVYNAPKTSEVAGIWIEGNDILDHNHRSIRVHGRSGKTFNVKSNYGCYDPLQYPLLFPKGATGWHHGICRSSSSSTTTLSMITDNHNRSCNHSSFHDIIEREKAFELEKKKRNDVSCREYYSYMFQIRDSTPNHILYTGRLFQQYVVDMYIKIETTRLNFFYNNQRAIRSKLYPGVHDSILAGEKRACNIGKRIILPASFIGGPRDMKRRFLDSMALVQRFGKPDIFLTMTCNPDWDEIKSELKHWEKAENRPDIITRVFHAKLEKLKKELFQNNIFGEVIARVHVIEFQKRGLPHAHFLLILNKRDKILAPEQYDKIVRAEIPDSEVEPVLYERVLKHMIHGPCGSDNPRSPCMIKNKCSKKFPKPFSDITMHNPEGYPMYRRRHNGRLVNVRGSTLSNAFVVPYNPYLLLKFNCHINVEICSSIKAVKYLYKYIYKGHDRVAIRIAPNNEDVVADEIKYFRDARWVSPPEAMWRIFEFNLNEIYPPVVQLLLHLHNQQIISFQENADLQNLPNMPNANKNLLTEFFTLNCEDRNAQNFLYREIPEHYVWDTQRRT